MTSSSLSCVARATLAAAAFFTGVARGAEPPNILYIVADDLGFSDLSFPAPLFHGDTIRVETEVTAARASNSRPNQGVVTFEHRAFNQHDVLVCRAVRQALMLASPADT